MNVGNSDANALAMQMMQQVSNVRTQTSEQLEALRENRQQLSEKALQKAAEKQFEAAERKANQIDLVV